MTELIELIKATKSSSLSPSSRTSTPKTIDFRCKNRSDLLVVLQNRDPAVARNPRGMDHAIQAPQHSRALPMAVAMAARSAASAAAVITSPPAASMSRIAG